ncbi:tRNA-uridine aminocarboxypropyltransferase [Lignipirellula cremea]|uniref:tRNA-uridine aminocarboxypropyltransferase n=1 Tax=Lignipirellula cremea TaxID=2528010 RepID=A0A518DKX3_9BACT|nr:tRNA-uridine aminocarboxypropyltransferase [Lignipirellula cremea]QDU92492.1 DTW domain protein [Lignipirellula cremea]
MFKRCYQCFRPVDLCFCEAIPRIDNRTEILLLQHRSERSHPFNTARIVKQALTRCQLVVGHYQTMREMELPIAASTGLLFPKADAPELSELSPEDRPQQLVVIDGTWGQAKAIVRETPQLHNLPGYRLSPSSPGRYRIRREPTPQSLSTLEAVVSALHVLEPETAGLPQLLAAFDRMVDDQLARSAGLAEGRVRKSRGDRPTHVPAALLDDEGDLVVAYGESTPGERGKRSTRALPVNWVARRLGEGEEFSCRLRQPEPLSASALEYMNLPDGAEDAVTEQEFGDRWARFLRPTDTLVVYHHRTLRLLENAGAAAPRCLVLKSIFHRWRSDCHSLEDLLAAEEIEVPADHLQPRAQLRLRMAVALVDRLRSSFAP